MTRLAPIPAALREQARTDYLALLTAANSPLLENAAIREQLVAQLDAVLDSMAPELRWRPAGRTRAGLSAEIGRSRAAGGVSPAQSLRAASLIFQACLPAITARLNELGEPDAAARGAVVLNAAILNRMAVAGMSYVEQLLTTAQMANQVERRRISRELHDVAAPTVVLAQQNVELHRVYLATNPAAAQDKLDAADESLRQLMSLIRDLATEMREGAAVLGLAGALRRYVDSVPALPAGATPPTAPALTLEVDPATAMLAPAYVEELFLIVREAIRNAVDHADATTVTATVRVADAEPDIDVLHVSVRDDGCGFDTSKERAAGHHGLDSLRERAELLAGTATVDSSPGRGTEITVRVPVPRLTGRYVHE